MLCRTHTRRKGNSGFLPPEKKKKKRAKVAVPGLFLGTGKE